MSLPQLLFRCPAASASTRRLFHSPSWALQSSRAQSFQTHLQSSRFLAEQPRHRRTATVSSHSSSSISRSYHSQHHPDPPPHEYSNSQTTILSAALAHVPDYGFTREALTLGARDVGFLDVSVQLFPRGEFDLILFWLASRRGLLRGKVENGLFENLSAHEGQSTSTSPNGLSVEEKVKILLLERLRMNAGIRHKWQDALALMSFPSNIPLSLSELHALSSDILSLAGDTSVDATWYTKRLSVSAIYASADVVMTRDSSPDFSETETFVQRRLEDCEAIDSKISAATQCLGFMGSTAAGLGRSWGLKM